MSRANVFTTQPPADGVELFTVTAKKLYKPMDKPLAQTAARDEPDSQIEEVYYRLGEKLDWGTSFRLTDEQKELYGEFRIYGVHPVFTPDGYVVAQGTLVGFLKDTPEDELLLQANIHSGQPKRGYAPVGRLLHAHGATSEKGLKALSEKLAEVEVTLNASGDYFNTVTAHVFDLRIMGGDVYGDLYVFEHKGVRKPPM